MSKVVQKSGTMVKKNVVKVKAKKTQEVVQVSVSVPVPEPVPEPESVVEPVPVPESEPSITESETLTAKKLIAKLASDKTLELSNKKKEIANIKLLVKEFSTKNSLKNTKELLDALLVSPTQHLDAIKGEITRIKLIIKTHDFELKHSKPKVKKASNPNRVRSGIDKPVVVSKEMYTFLEQFGVKNGELVAMTTALKYITTYIREQSLQNPEFKREILLDDTLQKLFSNSVELRDPKDPESKRVYTYTRIMTYILRHFKQPEN